MPILDDIMDHDVIGPAIRQGIDLGREEGIHLGRREEVLKVLGSLIAKRFGPLPASVDEQLTNLSIDELEQLSLRLLDAHSLDELMKP
jgi:hypothetical protein